MSLTPAKRTSLKDKLAAQEQALKEEKKVVEAELAVVVKEKRRVSKKK